MSTIWFDEAADAEELIKALEAEGYRTRLRAETFAGEDDAEDPSWALEVEPFDDGVVAMVDVYGGWLPGDPRLPADPLDLPDRPHH